MKNRQAAAVRALTCAALLIAVWAKTSLAAGAKRPNFVFVDICSLRADHMGAYGYSRPTTPKLDALAKSGVLFENAMSQSSWCLPNYASLFTGQRPEVHGLYTNTPVGLPDFSTTLAERLRDNGYRTAAFSGGVYMIPEWGLSRGFDTYVNLFSTSVPNRVPAPVEDNLAGVYSWLSSTSAQHGEPFFLYVAVDDLHAPYHADHPDRFDPGYKGIARDTDTMGVPFARAFSGEASGYSAEIAAKARAFKKDPGALTYYRAHYDAALATTDERVGELLARLKKLHLDKNTVVIVTADHGEMLGEKGLLGHTSGLYEGVLHVPLIVRDPAFRARAGTRLKQLVERVDLMPTILDRAGVDYSDLSLQGRSFLPLLQDPHAPWRDVAYASSHRNLAKDLDRSIDERVERDARWKLVSYAYRSGFELYDLKNDPHETRDVAAEHPEVVARLAFRLVQDIEAARPHEPGKPEAPRDYSLEPRAARN